MKEKGKAHMIDYDRKAIVKEAVTHALQQYETGTPQHKILADIIGAAEEIAGGRAVSSILLLDKQGLLRNGSSPQLPYDYLTAIDGLKPNADLGTCASAAATGSVVITRNFKSDNKWAELKHLPLALGFVGAWSMPIKTKDGKVLGTFGTYYRDERDPFPEEIACIKELSDTVAVILT